MTPEFKEAINKCPIVRLLHEAGDSPEGIILTLVERKDQLLQRVEELKLLVPKRVRMSDGSQRIWRCPEELIPVDEYNPVDIGNAVRALPIPEPTGDADD
jgi:hypothetical protein